MKFYFLVTMTVALAIAGCGGGNETVAGIDARGNPVASAVAARGAITGFGSVIVNGVTYDTSSATFTIDGSDGLQSDLAVGDVIVLIGTVEADGTSPTALSITFDDAVEGPITAIDSVAQTLTVLGQLVRIDAETGSALPTLLKLAASSSRTAALAPPGSKRSRPVASSSLLDSSATWLAPHLR